MESPKDIENPGYKRRPKRDSYHLALALFVLRIFTDNHDFSLTLDDFALFAYFFDRRPDFHVLIIPFTRNSVGGMNT